MNKLIDITLFVTGIPMGLFSAYTMYQEGAVIESIALLLALALAIGLYVYGSIKEKRNGKIQ